MKAKIKKLIENIESELWDIYQSYDNANDLLGELEEELKGKDILPPGTSWSHLAADTSALRDRLGDTLTAADKELLDHLCDILDALEKERT